MSLKCVVVEDRITCCGGQRAGRYCKLLHVEQVGEAVMRVVLMEKDHSSKGVHTHTQQSTVVFEEFFRGWFVDEKYYSEVCPYDRFRRC